MMKGKPVKPSNNGYGLSAFSTVKCTRCRHEMKVGGSSSGFCSNCDNHARLFGSRDKTRALVMATRPIAFPAEWIE